MLLTTQGLVLHTTKYAETSVIAKVFTRELGLRSYIVKGVRTTKGRTKQNLLQPLSHLEMTVYNNPKKQLQYIKEMHQIHGTQVGTQAACLRQSNNQAIKQSSNQAIKQSSNQAIKQSSNQAIKQSSNQATMALMFFMDEVLYKSLKEEEPNKPLFDYVVSELQALSISNAIHNSHFCNTPINFLLRTARYLGIEPMNNYSGREPLFNMKEGRFQAIPSNFSAIANPNVDYFLDPLASSHLHYYLNACHNNGEQPRLDSKQRNSTLNNLLEYYHIHFSDFNNFKSHEILHSVLR